ncbi:low temperature requirement protein A [Exiguobacterium sp. s189]|uniref:low temperature requirement protein A n=1 Tax=Exiguobacterium sp. s189 TaxID=2751263 RepID=UPI00352D4A43
MKCIIKRLYESEGRHASWLELFFDLIFVVFLGELIHSFGHTHHNHLDGAFFWKFPFLFLAIWWLWMQHTIYSNRFDNDGRIHRVLTLGVMLLIIIMNGVVSRGLEKNFVFFTILFISIQAIYLVMYMRVDNQDKSDSLFIKKIK